MAEKFFLHRPGDLQHPRLRSTEESKQQQGKGKFSLQQGQILGPDDLNRPRQARAVSQHAQNGDEPFRKQYELALALLAFVSFISAVPGRYLGRHHRIVTESKGFVMIGDLLASRGI